MIVTLSGGCETSVASAFSQRKADVGQSRATKLDLGVHGLAIRKASLPAMAEIYRVVRTRAR